MRDGPWKLFHHQFFALKNRPSGAKALYSWGCVQPGSSFAFGTTEVVPFQSPVMSSF